MSLNIFDDSQHNLGLRCLQVLKRGHRWLSMTNKGTILRLLVITSVCNVFRFKGAAIDGFRRLTRARSQAISFINEMINEVMTTISYCQLLTAHSLSGLALSSSSSPLASCSLKILLASLLTSL